MTPFSGNRAVRIAGVSVVELRVRRSGASPMAMAKVALQDAEGTPLSMAVVAAMSPETLSAIDKACKLIERDYVKILEVPNGEFQDEDQDGEDLDSVSPFGS